MAWVVAAYGSVVIAIAGYALHLHLRRAALRKELGEASQDR